MTKITLRQALRAGASEEWILREFTDTKEITLAAKKQLEGACDNIKAMYWREKVKTMELIGNDKLYPKEYAEAIKMRDKYAKLETKWKTYKQIADLDFYYKTKLPSVLEYMEIASIKKQTGVKLSKSPELDKKRENYALKRAQKKYEKKQMHFHVRFKADEEKLFKHLTSQPNSNEYIKKLIREDINK